MNLGETIAYWYFRLNGFFPLGNFVVHRHGHIQSDAETDLLAIRFPHVSEPIGGRPVDWDNEQFDEWQLCHRENIVCVLCEVKAGYHEGDNVAAAFSNQRIYRSLLRFGVFPEHNLYEIVPQLVDAATLPVRNVTFAKVLMVGSGRCVNRGDMPQCHEVSLRHAVQFIRNRFAVYQDEKSSAWTHFPNELIQFLIWELAKHFITHFQKAKHPIQGLFRQRDIFEKRVKPQLGEGKVAYVWVDALRFEMARELARLLTDERCLAHAQASGAENSSASIAQRS
jgi:hypothetical protein